MTSSILTDYLGQGPASARPTSPPIGTTALALYYADDTGVLSLWDTATSAWVTVSSGGTPFTAVGTGLTITTPGTVALDTLGTGLSISGGVIDAEWSGGTVNALGTGLAISGGSLVPNWEAGTITTVGPGLFVTSDTLKANWNGGTVTTLGSGLTLTSGTLTAAGSGSSEWTAGTVTAIGSGLVISGDTLSATGGGGGGNSQVVTFAPFTRPALSSFTWVNQITTTATDHANGPLTLITQPAQPFGVSGLQMPVPVSAPYTLSAQILMAGPGVGSNENYSSGIYFTDGTKFLAFNFYNIAGPQIGINQWASTTDNSNAVIFEPFIGSNLWLRMRNDGTTITFWISSNGADWVPFNYSEASGAFLATITACGFCINNNNSAQGIAAALNNWELVAGSGSTATFQADSATGGGGAAGLFAPVLTAIPTEASSGYTTWDNQGSSTAANNAMGFTLLSPSDGSNHHLHALYKAAPTAPYTATFLVMWPAPILVAGTGFFIGWRSSGGAYDGITSNPSGMNHTTWSSATTNVTYTGIEPAYPYQAWFSLTDDGTNATIALSVDGVNYQTIYTTTKSSGYLGASGYNQLAIASNPYQGVSGLTVASYSD